MSAADTKTAIKFIRDSKGSVRAYRFNRLRNAWVIETVEFATYLIAKGSAVIVEDNR